MKFIPDAVVRQIARHSLMAQKNAPSMLFASGIAGVVGSTILACRATLKVEAVLEEARENLAKIEIVSDEALATNLDIDYSEDDRKRDTVIVYVRAATRIVTLYAPALLLGAASIAALSSSHGMLTRRNAALTAAYAAVDRAFREYRERVVEKYGEDKDRELRYGFEKVEVTDDNGKTRTIKRVSPNEPSGYAKFFDNLCSPWSPDAEINRLFLQCQQNYFNELLKARGHVFLNEVYDALGIERTSAGQIVGWVVGRNGGDNYIDFGIFDGDRDKVRDFVNGRESAILLDFNVDGSIFDLIEEWNKDQEPWQS